MNCHHLQVVVEEIQAQSSALAQFLPSVFAKEILATAEVSRFRISALAFS